MLFRLMLIFCCTVYALKGTPKKQECQRLFIKSQFADTAYKSLPNRVLNACDILRRVALHNKGYESEYHVSSSIVAKKLDL